MTGPMARERLNCSELRATALAILGAGDEGGEHGLVRGSGLGLGQPGQERCDQDRADSRGGR